MLFLEVWVIQAHFFMLKIIKTLRETLIQPPLIFFLRWFKLLQHLYHPFPLPSLISQDKRNFCKSLNNHCLTGLHWGMQSLQTLISD